MNHPPPDGSPGRPLAPRTGPDAFGARLAARRSRLVVSVVVLLAWMAGGCTGSFGAGVRDYDHGRYPEAMARMREAEPGASTMGHRDRARYALYRGLVLLALGDIEGARRWLGVAHRAVEAEPSLLADDDLGRLSSAWVHLEKDGSTPGRAPKASGPGPAGAEAARPVEARSNQRTQVRHDTSLDDGVMGQSLIGRGVVDGEMQTSALAP